jgi:hypothetical protein
MALGLTLCALPRLLAADTPSTAASGGTEVFPAAPERDLVIRACAVCHPPEIVVAKRHSVDEWDDIIAKMVDRGAVVNDEEQQQILMYLAKFFGPT